MTRKFSESGITQIFLLMLLLVGLAAGLYLASRTQIFKPKADNSEIVVKKADGSSPSVDSSGIPQSDSAVVAVELTAPVASDAGKSKIVGYKIAETPDALNQTSNVLYKEPTVIEYVFKDAKPGNKFIWVEFRDGAGKTERRSTPVNLIAPSAGSNLVANPSFLGSSSFPVGWQTRSSTVWDKTAGHSDTNSLKVTDATTPEFKDLGYVYTFNKGVPSLKPNTKYKLSGWVKTQDVNGKGVYLRYSQIDPDTKKTIVVYKTSDVKGTSDWKNIETIFTTRSDYKGGRLDLVWDVGQGGMAWLDDISLTEETSMTTNSITNVMTNTIVGVPSLDPNYTDDVEIWWNNHPFNPNSSNYNPEIISPEPRINVKTQAGGSIKTALNMLPASGGTLYFEPGEYSATPSILIYNRDNIHFIADTQATIKGNISIRRCADSVDNYRNPKCYGNQVRNFYFKNLTFDGGFTQTSGIWFSSVRDAVLDNITLKNYVDPKDHHVGLINGNARVTNLWCRNCHFVGSARVAVYFDGLHGGGIINSKIERNFGSTGLLIITNDDLANDTNKNGTLENNEIRNSNYVAVVGNTFAGVVPIGVSATGAHMLVKDNKVEQYLPRFALFNTKSSRIIPTLTYQDVDLRVIHNTLYDVTTLVDINSASDVWKCPPNKNCAVLGKYVVKDNVIQKPSKYTNLVREIGTIQGPNVIQNNTMPK